MYDRLPAAARGVAAAWDFWLSQHDISIPETIERAVAETFDRWLDDNKEALTTAIAKESAPTVLVATPGGLGVRRDKLVDLRAEGIHLTINDKPAVRATTDLLRLLAKHIPSGTPSQQAAAFTAMLRFLLAAARESGAGDAGLLITDEQPGLDGHQLCAVLDPDGYVLMAATDD